MLNKEIEELYYWIKFHLLFGNSINVTQKLINFFKEVKEIFNAPLEKIAKISNIKEEKIKDILDNAPAVEEKIKKDIEIIKKYNIKLVTIFDKDYPENLKNIASSPPILYVRGDIKPEDKLAVGIVGSREPSSYGEIVAYKFSKELSSLKFTIISGLAKGIDYYAHLGAIKSGGRTIAALGTGIDVIYPKEQEMLFEQIIEHGGLISEFPIGTPPLSYNFPKRNRLISGLSLGIVVVEGGIESGAMITANFALKQGKKLFAVPGSITNYKSSGPHKLIKEGAKLVENVEDIIEEISTLNLIYKKSEEEEKRINEEIENLSELEKKIYNILSSEPLYIDEIHYKTGIASPEIDNILLGMELNGVIKELPGKMYVKIL